MAEQQVDSAEAATAADWLAEDSQSAYDEDYDPVYEAKSAALEASQTLVKTLQAQLDAFENGDLDEEEDAATAEETGEMLKTLKLRVQEVENAEAEEAQKLGDTAGRTAKWGTMKKKATTVTDERDCEEG